MATKQLKIPAEHPCYAAHFPDQPLVPGALLLHWLVDSLQESIDDKPYAVPSCKFLAPVMPGSVCQLEFSGKDKDCDRVISVSLLCDKQLVLKAKLHYRLRQPQQDAIYE